MQEHSNKASMTPAKQNPALAHFSLHLGLVCGLLASVYLWHELLAVFGCGFGVERGVLCLRVALVA